MPAPDLVISPQNPLLILGWSCDRPPDESPGQSAARWAREWSLLPDDLRQLAVMVIEMLDPLALFDATAALDEAAVPYLVQVRCWVPVTHRELWRSPPLTLANIERLYRERREIKGIQIVEMNCFGFSTEERLYVADCVEISARYGKIVSWQEANDGCNLWLEVGLDRHLYEALRAHPEHWIPQWEMNIHKSMYLCHGSVMGLWLAGAARHWGLEPQSWYWWEVGYADLDTPTQNHTRGYRNGDLQKFPPTLWAQMTLLGLSSGATVYSYEPWDAFMAPRRDRPSLVWEQVLAPLLRFVLRHGIIPDERAVRQQIRVAYVADFASAEKAEESDVDYYRNLVVDAHPGLSPADDVYATNRRRGRGIGTLWQGTYGIRHDAECIPNHGRYYWVPILPKYTRYDQLVEFPQVIGPNAFPNESEVRRFFDERYPAWHEATAWVTRVGDAIFISQTHENLDVQEQYSVPLHPDDPGRVEAVTGTVGPHAFGIVAVRPEGLHIHLNGWVGREDEIAFLIRPGAEPPEITCSPQTALRSSEWDEAARRLRCRVRYEGAVGLTAH